MHKNSHNSHNILFILLIVIVFTLPWFHGGEIRWQFNFFQIILFISLGVVAFKYQITTINPEELVLFKSLKTPVFLLIALIILTFTQTLSLPLHVVELVSPKVASYYRDSSQLLGRPEALASLSISKTHTLQELFKQASYLAVFILTLLLVNTKSRAIWLITMLFGTAVLTAIHAIINYHTSGSFFYIETLYPWQASDFNIIHGPFSYKNHYAAFLIITIPLGIGLLFYQPIKKVKKRTLHVLNFVLSKRSVLIAACSFLLAILIFNTSRAGLLAFCASILLSLLFCWYLYPKKLMLKQLVIPTISILAVLGLIFMSGLGDRLLERVSNYGENGRDTLRTTSVTIIQDHYLLGTGAGTFPTIQHTYKSELLSAHKMWQHAHNDYLEMLSNQGIIGGGLLGIAILLLLYTLIVSIKNNHNSLRVIQIACLCSLLAILIHSFADFNFQLPVIAVYFYIILALGLKLPLLKS